VTRSSLLACGCDIELEEDDITILQPHNNACQHVLQLLNLSATAQPLQTLAHLEVARHSADEAVWYWQQAK